MTEPMSKIPQGKSLENGALKENPQYEQEKQYVRAVQQSNPHPFSVGKQRNRAK